jgi:hypothetical protein
MSVPTPPKTTVYGMTKCLPEKKSEADGPCIIKINKDNKIISIPKERIVSKLRDLKLLSLWRSVPNPNPGELTEPEITELERNLLECQTLDENSFALLERLIGEGGSGDSADTTNTVDTEENRTILQNCDLLKDVDINELERILSIPGGKRKSKKNKSKKNKSKKNKSKKNNSRKTKSRKSKLRKK